jgi:hypothetical protein
MFAFTFDGGPDDTDYTTAASIAARDSRPSSLPVLLASSQLRHPHATVRPMHVPPTTTMRRLMNRLAFLILGFAPFTFINTLWSQTSIFRSCLPEGNGIATLIGGAYNAASILPLLYMFLVTRFRLSDRAVAVVGSLFGVAVAVVLAIFWKDTVLDCGAASSVVVIALWRSPPASSARCSASSSSPTLPTFRRSPPRTLSLGMGINGVLVTGLGFAQKAGASSTGAPLFSPAVAFYMAPPRSSASPFALDGAHRVAHLHEIVRRRASRRRLPAAADETLHADSNNDNDDNSNNLKTRRLTRSARFAPTSTPTAPRLVVTISAPPRRAQSRASSSRAPSCRARPRRRTASGWCFGRRRIRV